MSCELHVVEGSFTLVFEEVVDTAEYLVTAVDAGDGGIFYGENGDLFHVINVIQAAVAINQ